MSGGGFEWFGNAPASNVLTAYGLMEFVDMAEVYDVDPAVIERTRRWLYSQQKSDGSWEASRGGLHGGNVGKSNDANLRTTAYIAWALAESRSGRNIKPRLRKAVDFLEQRITGKKDPYTLALSANAFVAADSRDAGDVLGRLVDVKTRKDDLVHWQSDSKGVTYSRGDVLNIETTALAAYAMLQAGRHTSTAHKALAWLIDRKDSHGTWHSTQATVHAMRALLAGTGSGGSQLEKDMPVAITVNGQTAEKVTITPETSDVFRLISLRQYQEEGMNSIAIEPAGQGNMAYQIVSTYYLPWPKKETREVQKEMSIDVVYNTKTLKTDEKLTCTAAIRYNRPGTARMTVVDLGLPPGFEVVSEDFERLKDQGVIQRYSITGRQVILYFERIPGGEPVKFTYHLRAKYPVKAKTPPTEVYQYYEPEVRDATEPVELQVR